MAPFRFELMALCVMRAVPQVINSFRRSLSLFLSSRIPMEQSVTLRCGLLLENWVAGVQWFS
jgi:hypothetical protein